MYFEQAAVDIRGLPKLEGTVHVNIALIVKFMPNFFFAPAEYPPVATASEAANDDFLFHQGGAKGLGQIQFHDYRQAFAGVDAAQRASASPSRSRSSASCSPATRPAPSR